MKCLRQRKAFTVVEMVIVIAVIAILATVLVPTIAGVIQMANKSADQQFAASLNVQLALWQVDNGEIASESDLRDAINEYYNTDENPDFYSSLTPKSGKQGFHYWWNATDKQVVLASYEELAKEDDGTSGQAEAGEPTFSPASPRSLMIETDEGWKNYFLMDQGGSDVADTLNALEELPGPTEYKNIIDKLQALEEDADDIEILTAISDKVETITIVTDGGAFRYGSTDYTVDNIDYIWVSPDATLLKQTKVYVFNGTDVDDGQHSDDLAADVMDIYLPSGVSVGLGGLNAPVTESDPQNVYESTTRLHVDTTEVTELLKVYTDCVLVMSNGSKYVWVGDQLYPLPLQIGADGKPTGSVGSVDDETMGSIGGFGITCGETSSDPGEGKAYLLDGTVYVAYDKGTVQLSLTDGVTNGMVDWTSGNSDVATVDGYGKVTLKLPEVKAGAVYDAVITATYKYDTTKTASIKVYVVRPTSVALTLGGQSLSVPATNHEITLTYTDNAVFTVGETISIGYSQSGYVAVDGQLSYSTSGDMFTVDETTGTVTVNPEKITSSSQTLTVTYKNGETIYLKQDFAVTVKDNSASPFSVNNITDDVKMGATYLFRVGNANEFTLGKLFNCDKPGDKITLTIYDAVKTTGTGGLGEIATSGSGFTASYTSELDSTTWANSTIQFSGTGVAIIKITTSKGTAELAVEVVDGYNITDASQLKSNANNILLNDIQLASGGSFSLTGNATNHKVLYGNGFTFDITKGKTTGFGVITLTNADIDNAKIIGAAYSTYAATYSATTEYYASAVYVNANSRISNSYISGCRANVRVQNLNSGGTLELVDTVLDCGRFANLDAYGNIFLNGVTTVNEPREGNDIAGLGIAIPDEGEGTIIEIGEKGITQYNWLSEADESKLPSFYGKELLFNTMFGSSYTQFQHKVNGTGTTYVNMGIISLSSEIDAGNFVYDKSDSWAAYYTGQVASLATFNCYVMSVDSDYTLSADDLVHREEAYSWVPSKQSASLPTFTWTSGFEDYAHELSFKEGESVTFNANVLSAQKFGTTLQVNVKLDGNSTYAGGEIEFTEPGTYTFIYAISDNLVYEVNGTSTTTADYEFRLVVVVTEIIETIKDPLFTFTNGTGYEVVEKDGQLWINPTFDSANASKFQLVNGIYAPVSAAQFKDNTSDFNICYGVFDGYSITNYTEKGESAAGTVYNSSYNATALPSNMTGTAPWNNGKGISGYEYNSSKGGFICKTNAIGSSGSDNIGDGITSTVTYSFTAGNGKTYYYYVYYTIAAHKCPSVCVTPDTLVTLADGTQKEIQYVTNEDLLLVWNFYTGEYDTVPASIVMNHGYGTYTVVSLNFSDGTTVKTINGHGFFDVGERKYVILNDANVANYIGHQFAKVDGDSYTNVTLDSYSITEEYTESWSILTAEHYNCILENVWTLTPAEVEGSPDYLMPFEIGADMKYDEAKMQADIEKYGLYTYEDFAEYCTYEQFVGFGFANFKVSVGKGYITWDGIEFLLNLHLGEKNN